MFCSCLLCVVDLVGDKVVVVGVMSCSVVVCFVLLILLVIRLL